MPTGPYVLGIDLGTESARAGIFTLAGTPVIFAAEAYPLYHPFPGWAEQKPDEWWTALVKAVRRAWRRAAWARAQSRGSAPTAPVARSWPWTSTSSRCARPSLDGCACGGSGDAHRARAATRRSSTTASAMYRPSGCRARRLWLKEKEPESYRQARYLGEFTEWLTYRLTGEWVASINNASIRWYYDRAQGGWPVSFYEQHRAG